MPFYQIIILMILGCLIAYLFVDRICKCIEHKRITKSFDKFMENTDDEGLVTVGDRLNYIESINEIFNRLENK